MFLQLTLFWLEFTSPRPKARNTSFPAPKKTPPGRGFSFSLRNSNNCESTQQNATVLNEEWSKHQAQNR